MNSLFRFFRVLLLAGFAVGASSASIIDFTYSGIGGGGYAGFSGTGTGSFATNVTDGTADIGDLSSFNFALSVTDGTNTDYYNYGLADLTAFQATFSSGLLTDLSLTTISQPAIYNYGLSFEVSGLGANQADTTNGDGNPTIGAITLQNFATPEPGTLTLAAGACLVGAAWLVRRLGR
jgi:hypothetical protein